MIIRQFVLGVIALTSIAATTPPPAVLTPYIKDGQFDPGDYRWMIGQFDGATFAQKADRAAIDAWLAQCRREGIAATRAELAALGQTITKIDNVPFLDPICFAVSVKMDVPAATRFADIERALPQARLVADTYLFAVAAADQYRPDDPTAALIARPVSDQMLRRGEFWGEGEAADAPKLDPITQALVVSRLTVATFQRDRANTEWLKGIVARNGWPSVSKVGRPASEQAWLLAQHADADPAFQLKALRLMKPLEAAHDLPPRNYAYLYDRVMLKLVGTQRYGTQATCKAGKRTPQPLEDAAKVSGWRRKAGLDPLDDYLAQMNKLYGPCPPDVIPPSPAKH